MTTLKVVCWITGIIGVITAGVCIWLLAVPVELPMGLTANIGNSPKVGIAVAVFMILIGICSCFIDVEKRFPFYAVTLFVVLVLCITFMAIAVHDHQDLKKSQDLTNNADIGSIINSQNFNSYQRNQVKNAYKVALDAVDSLLTRLKVIAAVGGVDSIILLICFILFLIKRPKHSSRNTMQMERKL